MKQVTIKSILKKKNKNPIVCLTAYSKHTAIIADKYCDLILVGDSLAMVLYGMKSTKEIKIDTMILHAKAVKKFTKKSLVVFDMPYGTYTNKIIAYKNAKRAIKITKCDAVKLEGGNKIINIIKHLIKNKIPVQGHLGLLPQSQKGKFRYKGKNLTERNIILRDAKLLEAVGVFSIVLECVETSLAKLITKTLTIPTIGIGASHFCDGQILVIDDLIGLNPINARFVKKYSNIKKVINNAVSKFSQDVKKKNFPKKKHSY